MHLFVRTVAMTAAFALGVAGGVLIAGREDAAEPVFTIEQAVAGKAAYAKSCASCHLPDLSGSNEIPALAGQPFKDAWGARTTKELFDYMSAAMPYGGPSLTPDAYLSILAYILQSNGAASGSHSLSSSTAVRIDSLTSAQRSARSPNR
jgi:polar amino acid transport system substrate-binding protein